MYFFHKYFVYRHLIGAPDIQHNDTQHNDTRHNNTQHNDTHHNDIQLDNTLIATLHKDAQHNGTLNGVLLSVINAECHKYALLPSDVILSVFRMNIVAQSHLQKILSGLLWSVFCSLSLNCNGIESPIKRVPDRSTYPNGTFSRLQKVMKLKKHDNLL